MARDRFMDIHRYLHFTDNSSIAPRNSDGYDRLCKVREILSMLEDKFLTLYDPNCQCAIDEAMVPYKGRSSLKQYLPKKPIKRGLKVWMRADSVTGYISQFQVYVGKQTTSSEKGLGSRVVKDLTRSLTHRYYHVYCDNFFTGPVLFHHLYQEGIYACGTVRSNRTGFPKDLKSYTQKGLHKRGESVTLQSDLLTNLTVSVWQDTKPVSVCATNCQSVPLHTVQRKLRSGDSEVFPCPESITSYNNYMGGVDRNDQLRQYYHVRLKSRKYYKYLFWMIFDVTITNAYLLSQMSLTIDKRATKSVKDFRVCLSKELLEGYCTRKRRGRRPRLSPKKFHCDHFPEKGDGKQHRCDYCRLQGKRSETKWFCSDCNVYLCHKGCRSTDCFILYHKKYL